MSNEHEKPDVDQMRDRIAQLEKMIARSGAPGHETRSGQSPDPPGDPLAGASDGPPDTGGASDSVASPDLMAAMNRNPDLLIPVVVGRVASRNVVTSSGQLIASRGTVITTAAAEMARNVGMLSELWVCASLADGAQESSAGVTSVDAVVRGSLDLPGDTESQLAEAKATSSSGEIVPVPVESPQSSAASPLSAAQAASAMSRVTSNLNIRYGGDDAQAPVQTPSPVPEPVSPTSNWKPVGTTSIQEPANSSSVGAPADSATESPTRAGVPESVSASGSMPSPALQHTMERHPELMLSVVIGKVCAHTILADGTQVAVQGQIIDQATAEKAAAMGKLFDLWMAAQEADSYSGGIVQPSAAHASPEGEPEIAVSVAAPSVVPAEATTHSIVAAEPVVLQPVVPVIPSVEIPVPEPVEPDAPAPAPVAPEAPAPAPVAPEATAPAPLTPPAVEAINASLPRSPQPVERTMGAMPSAESAGEPMGYLTAVGVGQIEPETEQLGYVRDPDRDEGSISALKVDLRWDAAPGATGYNIKRSSSPGGPYAILAGGVFESQYADYAVASGLTYYYVVSALSLSGESADSVEMVATPLAPPAAPVGLTAMPGHSQVTLTWLASVGSTGYNVKRSSMRGGPFTLVATGLTNTVFTDLGLANDVWYYYLVTSLNAGGESTLCSEVAARPTAPPLTPIKLEAWPGNGQVTLAWEAVPASASYNIRRSLGPGASFTVVACGVTSPSYIDAGLANGTAYHYTVSAVNTGGESAPSEPACAVPVDAPTGPTGLVAESGNGHVALSWRRADGAESYNVKRSNTLDGPYVTVATPVVGESYLDSSVVNGRTYYYLVTAVNAGGESRDSNEVSVRPVAPPNAPAGTVGTAGNAQVSLSWAPSAGALTYRVKRSEQMAGPYTELASGLSGTTYVDSSAVNGKTYYYVVSAVSAGGDSPHSIEVIVNPVAPPVAPSGLSAVPGNGQVALSWNAAPGATGYSVKRAGNRGGPYFAIGTDIPIPNYVDASVTNGAQCFYVISATNPGGESPDSAEITARPVAPPSPPMGVAAVPGNGQVFLSWASSTGAVSYSIKRALSAEGPYSSLASSVTGTSYTDATVNNGTAYYYVITGVNPGGEGPDSDQVRAVPVFAPPAVSGLTAMPRNGQVAIGWEPSVGAETYTVKRAAMRGGPFIVLATGITAQTYLDASVSNGAIYYYVVTAVNAGGESDQGLEVMARPVGVPQPPQNLTAVAGNQSVRLTWSSSGGASSFNVKRSPASGGPYTTIATPVTGLSYVDIGLTNGSMYFYVVTAVNAGGQSEASQEATGRPVAPPAAPAGIRSAPGNSRVSLDWILVTEAESYNVKRSTSMGGPYTLIATGVTATSYLDSMVANGQTYYYLVTAVNGGGESGASSESSCMPVSPPAPTGEISAAPGNGMVTLNWAILPGAAGYNVKRSLISGGPYALVAAGILINTYVDQPVENGTTYYYVISGLNAGGESPDSVEVFAAPVAPPLAPGGLTALPGNAQVSLRWQPADSAVGYNVKRSTEPGGPYTTLARGISTTSCTDAIAANGTLYYYVVAAINAGGESGNSSEVEAEPESPPMAPTVVTASPGNARVSLLWSSAPGTRTYNVKRSESANGPYKTIVTGVTDTSYVDRSVINGVQYFYVVSAANLGGESGNSPEANGQPVAPARAPEGVVAVAGNNHVTLTWNLASGASTYNIKRSLESDGPYDILAVGVLGGAYNDSTATNGRAYYYTISAINVGGESGNSQEVSAAPSAPPAAPTGLNTESVKLDDVLAGAAREASEERRPVRPTVVSGVAPPPIPVSGATVNAVAPSTRPSEPVIPPPAQVSGADGLESNAGVPSAPAPSGFKVTSGSASASPAAAMASSLPPSPTEAPRGTEVMGALARNDRLLMQIVVGQYTDRDIILPDGRMLIGRGQHITTEAAQAAMEAGTLYDLWLAAVKETR